MSAAVNKASSGRIAWVIAILVLVPLAIMVGKWSALPTSPFLMAWASLAPYPAYVHEGARHILYVPLGAMLVVFCRLTLGIRILGPFRSVLLAVAFQVTGKWMGLLFLAAVMVIVLAVRPLLRHLRMPYFGRVSAILSIVAAVMVFTLVAGAVLKETALLHVASLPIVVLCLMGEGLARTLTREGVPSALWRGTMTALLAVAITAISEIGAVRGLLIEYPEVLILQIGCVLFIARFMNFRLIEWVNPKAKKRHAKAKKALPENT
jgi:hypothetical protein